MARQGKTLPARRTRPAMDDSTLIRSAESLGRMIGSLQRQLDGASKKLNVGSGGLAGIFGVSERNDGERGDRPTTVAAKNGAPKNGAPKKAPKAAGKGGGKSGATKVRSTADRASKRTARSAAAKKSAGRTPAGRATKRSR